MTRNSVDLPAPLRPTIDTRSPRSTSSVTASSSGRWPKATDTRSRRTRGTSSEYRMTHDRAAERLGAERQKQLSLGDRQREVHAPLEPCRDRGDEIAIDRVQVDRVRAVDALARVARDELRRVLVGVD